MIASTAYMLEKKEGIYPKTNAGGAGMKRLERLEKLRERMCDKDLLEELVRAMSDKTADEYFDYIVSNNEIEED